MKRIGKMTLAIVVALCLTACAAGQSACLKSRMDRHEVRSLDFWQDYRRGNLEDRLHAAPQPLLDYLHLDNRLNGYDTRPQAAVADDSFRQDVRQALAELPGPVQAAVKEKLIGIFFVRNLGTTGYTEAVADPQGKPAAGFVVLDVESLRRTANAWATFRENTVFQNDGEGRLRVTLEEAPNDNAKNAIQFILLHEFGHLVSIGERFHPDWLDKTKTEGTYLFYPLSWRKAKDGSNVSLFEDVFPERRDVRFYGEPRLKSSQMEGVYRSLAMTNFVSLYGATSPFEDFAESFALYVHSAWMKKPYRVEITQSGNRVFLYESCWDQPRCAAKRAVLEKWFSRFRKP
ncbi:MAG: hypothetical protein PHQ63_09655 [Smithellaceae bacterium]|nr:hypothetical protein [Smithellaceae bacterium]